MNQETQLMSIGDKLRQKRELKRFSLEDAAAATKVRIAHLQALEADEFDKLPGELYLRMHLTTYAEYLNLNIEDLLRQLDGEYNSPAKVEKNILPVGNRNEFSPTPLILFLCLVAIITAYVIFMYND